MLRALFGAQGQASTGSKRAPLCLVSTPPPANLQQGQGPHYSGGGGGGTDERSQVGLRMIQASYRLKLFFFCQVMFLSESINKNLNVTKVFLLLLPTAFKSSHKCRCVETEVITFCDFEFLRYLCDKLSVFLWNPQFVKLNKPFKNPQNKTTKKSNLKSPKQVCFS